MLLWYDINIYGVYRLLLCIVVSVEAGVVRLRSWLELYTQYESAARNISLRHACEA